MKAEDPGIFEANRAVLVDLEGAPAWAALYAWALANPEQAQAEEGSTVIGLGRCG